MPRYVSANLLADNAEFDRAWERSAVVSETTADKIAKSAQMAARSAAAQAKAAGASASEQQAAAARAAVSYTEAADKISRAQQVAGKAAMDAARVAGKSADEQVAAWQKAVAATGEYEASQKRAAAATEAAAARQAKAAEESAARVSAAHKKLASLGKWTIAGGLGAGFFSVKGAADLQAQMERLHTQAGASQKAVQQLTGSVMNMAGSVGTGPQQLAQAMYHVTSAFQKAGLSSLDNAAKLQVLRVAAEGAKTGGADLVDVTNALDAAVVSGVRGVSNYKQAMGALNATVGAGDMTMQNLADALSTGLLGPMKTYGLSIKDVGGALAVFGDNNIRGQEAATKLTSAIRIMAAPSTQAAKALAVVGISATQLADDMRKGGIVQAIADLKNHLEESGLTASQQALIITRAFGGRQSTGVQVLIGQLDRLKAKTQEVGKGAGTFNADWVATTHTLKFQLDQVGAASQAEADKIGMWLLPKVHDLIVATEDVTSWLGKHKAAAETLAGVIGGVLTTAVAVFAYDKAVAFANGVKGMITGTVNLGGKLLGMTPIFAGSTSETQALTTAVEELTAALSPVAADGTAAAGGVDALGSAAATATPEVAGLDTTAGGLLGVLTKLSKLGTIAITVTVAFEAFNQIKNILNSHNGYQAMAPQTTAARNLLGMNALGGRMSAAAFDRLEGINPSSLSTVSASSPAWAILGISKSRWEKMTPSQRAAVTGTGGGSSGRSGTPPGYTYKASTAYNAKAFPRSENEFITTLASQTGLSPAVIAGWALAEQPAGTAANSANPYNFLNIAENYGNYRGSPTSIWKNPLTAAQATAEWIKTGKGVPGWSSGGVPGIVSAAGGSLASQISAIQHSGWVTGSSRQISYPNLAADVQTAMGHATMPTASPSTLAAYNALVGSGSSSTRSLSTGSIATTLANTISRYEGLATSATSGAVAALYRGFVAHVHALAPKFESEAKNANSSAGMTKVREALSQTLTAMESALAASVKKTMREVMAREHATKAGDSLLQRFQSVTQSGTSRTLENALGVSTGGTAFHEFLPSHGFGSEFAPSYAMMLHGEIEAMRGNVSTGGIQRALGGTLARSTQGSAAGARFEQEMAALLATGQTKLADKLADAHKAAMAALANTLYAEQRTRDGQMLTQQATALRDQTTAVQNAMQNAQTLFQAQEKQVNDMASATVQSMQDMQQTVNDRMAGMVQAVRDATQLSADQSNGIVQAIQDQTQIQVDTIGEKGLYGLHLVAQKLQVQADITKAGFDHQIAIAKQNIDLLQMQADQQENLAQINLDQVTEQQHALVAAAQQKLDTTTVIQEARITRAQSHADAVQLHVDTSLIGPAQMALDMQANASKSVQAKFQAQLAAATGHGDKQVAGANFALANVQASAQKAISSAQSMYDTANNTANQTIQGASDFLANLTNRWNYTLSTAQQGLQTLTNTAGQIEATQARGVAVTGAQASTQFAGSGLTVQIFGADLNNAGMISDATSWAIRTSAAATP